MCHFFALALVLTHLVACVVLQVTKKLPSRGLGTKLQRLKWKDDSYWTITAVKPSLVSETLLLVCASAYLAAVDIPTILCLV